ncbi:hypothetical protein [Aquimarina sp. I32.4]|uniref:hypothetical protein n=1 Tax=Aquimarina sp. I32.4 TaxID=2053903 RepID=UPI000CDF0833|nr:hypothetical protein [Aquimarina sp. I32.4]
MVNNSSLVFVFTFLLIILPKFFYAQAIINETPAYYRWFDNSVGVNNTGLYNGIEYEEEYKVKSDKNQFFDTKNFIRGTVKYDGQSYFNLSLKYNIYQDEILVKLPNGFGEIILQLIKDKVDNFSIGNHQFSRIASKKEVKIENKGFYQNLAEYPSLSLYLKHKKVKKEYLENKKISYEFIDKYIYGILYNQQYYQIKNQKDIISIFPNFKKDIQAFYKKNRLVRKSNPDIFYKSLSKHIHTWIIEKNN